MIVVDAHSAEMHEHRAAFDLRSDAGDKGGTIVAVEDAETST